MPSRETWSKIVLLTSSLLFLWGLLGLAAIGVRIHRSHHQAAQHEHGPHHGFDHQHHHDGPSNSMSMSHDNQPQHRHYEVPHCARRAIPFLVLAFLTGLTGMVSAFTSKRCWVRVFVLLLMLLYFACTLRMVHAVRREYHHCLETATKTTVERDIMVIQAPGVVLVAEKDSAPTTTFDQEVYHQCTDGVRHIGLLVSAILGVVFFSCFRCTGGFLRAIEAENGAAASVGNSGPYIIVPTSEDSGEVIVGIVAAKDAPETSCVTAEVKV